MDQEIKTLLKSAKDTLKAKEYTEALKICKVKLNWLIIKLKILINLNKIKKEYYWQR